MVPLKWAEKVAFWEMGSWIDFEGPVDLTVGQLITSLSDRS